MMLPQHEETQSQLTKISIDEVENFKRTQPGKSFFASEAGQSIKNNSKIFKCSMKVVQDKKDTKQEKVQAQPFQQVTNRIVTPTDNIVRIKPKNRTPSVIGCQKSNENSVHPLKTESKPKRTAQLKDTSKKIDIESGTVQFKSTKILTNPKLFILKPTSEGEVTRCRVIRYSSIFQNNLLISLKGQSKLLLTYSKQFKLFGNKYMLKLPNFDEQSLMSQGDQCNQKQISPYFAKIQSNFDGSLFNVYEISQNNIQFELVATIQYFADVGKSGAPRQIKIYYKDRSIPIHLPGITEQSNLRDYLKLNGGDSIKVLQAKAPTYNNQKDLYGLQFRKKMPVQPSVHNTIMVDTQGKVGLKFYKIQDREYELECFSPVTPLVASVFVISSFAFKLVSQ